MNTKVNCSMVVSGKGGSYVPATKNTLGAIKVGYGLHVDVEGTTSVDTNVIQTVESLSLNTTSKTIVGAINEVNEIKTSGSVSSITTEFIDKLFMK